MARSFPAPRGRWPALTEERASRPPASSSGSDRRAYSCRGMQIRPPCPAHLHGVALPPMTERPPVRRETAGPNKGSGAGGTKLTEHALQPLPHAQISSPRNWRHTTTTRVEDRSQPVHPGGLNLLFCAGHGPVPEQRHRSQYLAGLYTRAGARSSAPTTFGILVSRAVAWAASGGAPERQGTEPAQGLPRDSHCGDHSHTDSVRIRRETPQRGRWWARACHVVGLTVS